MNRFNVIFPLLLIVILKCMLYHDEYYAEGFVANSITKKGIEGAEITLTSKTSEIVEGSTYSDSKGYFQLSINLGIDSSNAGLITIKKEGYKSYSKKLMGFSGAIEDSFYIDQN